MHDSQWGKHFTCSHSGHHAITLYSKLLVWVFSIMFFNDAPMLGQIWSFWIGSLLHIAFLYWPVKTILWIQIQIHAQLLLCQLVNLISTDRSVQGVYEFSLGQKHWNRGFDGGFFSIIMEMKPCSFKSNSNYLVTSTTCVDWYWRYILHEGGLQVCNLCLQESWGFLRRVRYEVTVLKCSCFALVCCTYLQLC